MLRLAIIFVYCSRKESPSLVGVPPNVVGQTLIIMSALYQLFYASQILNRMNEV